MEEGSLDFSLSASRLDGRVPFAVITMTQSYIHGIIISVRLVDI